MKESDAIDLCGPDAELGAVLDVEDDAEELSTAVLSMALFLFGAAHQIQEN